MNYVHEWISSHFWVAELAGFLILLFLLNTLLKKALRYTKNKTAGSWFCFDDTILAPARVLLYVIAFTFFLDFLGKKFSIKEIPTYSSLLMNGATVLCLAWFLFRWKSSIYKKMRMQGNFSLDSISLELIDKLSTVAILFVSTLVLFGLFKVNIVPLITFGGIGAAALGFASKDVIANFFGGFTLHASRPFVVNDQIELPQKKLIGHVERIGWYFTSIRALDKKLIYIPNYVFPTELVVNYSRMTHRYFHETIAICWEDGQKVPALIEQIRNYLKHSNEIDQTLSRFVFVDKLADQTIEIEIKAHTFATGYAEFMQVKQNILLEIHRMIDQAGLARPVTTLKISGNN